MRCHVLEAHGEQASLKAPKPDRPGPDGIEGKT
jgi:hypothetical protein